MRVLKLLLPLVLLGLLVSCGGPEWEDGYASLDETQRTALDEFMTTDRGRLILCGQADLNDDGILDVVLLYEPAKGTHPVPDHDGKAMCVLVSTPGGFRATNSLPAPYERQHIQFRDIDDRPPQEFVVSGAKGAKTGLGVYRVYGETVENLFGESMDECC